MNIIEAKNLSDSKINKLKTFYGNLPEFIIYEIKSLLDLDKIDNQELSNSIKEYFSQNIEKKENLNSLLEQTSGLCYEFNNKTYIFYNNSDECLFHEMAHAIYSKKIKEISKLKGINLSQNQFILLDEFVAEYFSTIATKSLNRIFSCFSLIRTIKNNNKHYLYQYHSNYCYYLGAYKALKDINELPDLFAKILPDDLDKNSSLIYSSLVFNNKNLLDIDFDKFLTIYN